MPTVQQLESASSPLYTYRRLTAAALLLPLLMLLAAMSWMQYRTQRHTLLIEEQALAQTRLNELDGITEAAVEHVTNMRHWMEADMASATPSYSAELLQMLSPRLLDGHNDGYALDKLPASQRSYLGQFLWIRPSRPKQAELNRFAYFSGPASMAHALKPYFAWSYYFSAEGDLFTLYPWTPTRTLVEDQGQQSMLKTIHGWLDYDVFKYGKPERNVKHASYWVPPYVDAGGKGLMVSHAAPVMDTAGHFKGIVGTDVVLNTLQGMAQRWRGRPGHWWVVTQDGLLLADSGSAVLGSVKDTVVPAFAQRLPSTLTAKDLAAAERTPGLARETDDGVVYVLPSRHAPWHLVYHLSDREIRASLWPHLIPYLQFALLILLAFFAGQYMVQRNVMQPALAVLDYLLRRTRHPEARAPRISPLWEPILQTVVRTFDEQRQTQQAQLRSEAFKAAVVDNAMFAIVTTDEQGRIVEFNPAAERLFGLPRASALDRIVSDVIIPQRYRQAHLAGMARMKAGEAPRVIGQRVEMEALRADGSEIPVEMVLARSDVDGQAFYNAFMVDLTERRRVAAEVDRQREALRQSEKLTAMGSLLAGVAHELNNPLAILMGRASLLESKSRDPDVVHDAQRIRDAAERCGRIVRTFLNMARSRHSERHAMQLNDMVRGAVELMAYSMRTSGIDVRLDLNPDLPEILADGDQIGQIVLNLLVNAQHAMRDMASQAQRPCGPPRIHIHTCLTRHPDGTVQAVCLRVRDHGPGVSADIAARIFDPFFTTKAAGTGTGLGLSVSRAIARDHGGDLVLQEPDPAEPGASFLLTLPAQPTQSAPEPVDQAKSASAIAHDEALARVLVVDDEQDLADVMRAMLESQGYEVMTAESGLVAMALIGETHFDLVLSDLRMPDMDGPALWREIAKAQPELAGHVVFVTGDTLSAGASQFLEETGCICVEKPFTQAELLRVVQERLPR